MACQPDSVLSFIKAMDDLSGLDYLSHGPNTESVHDFTVIRKDLTRQLTKILPDVLDEMMICGNEKLGSDTEQWIEVKLWEVMMDITNRALIRSFVGVRLARDRGYNRMIRWWTIAFGVSGTLSRYLTPYSWRRWILPVVAIPPYVFQCLAARYLLPRIRQRLRDRQQGVERAAYGEKPNDMMQWIIDHNATKDDPAEMRPMNIAGRMILLNVFFNTNTPLLAILVLVDILSYARAPELLEALRAEAETIWPRAASDPRALREMVKLDSVIRETLRFNAPASQGLLREVMVPGGITAPSGTYLPQGSHVVAIASFVHCDPEIAGEGADVYDPDRFWKAAGDGTHGRRKMAVEVSDRFLSWGLGRHACPGRFLAVNTIKLLLGHMLVTYEIEPFTERPKLLELGDVVLPGSKCKIRVKRRKTQADDDA